MTMVGEGQDTEEGDAGPGAVSGGWGAHAALMAAAGHATRFLDGLADQPVGARANIDELRTFWSEPLPEGPSDPADVVRQLAAIAEPGLVGMAGGRYFGFVIGGAHPAAVGADWLATAWDQNAGLYACGPSAAVAEETAGRWLLQLFGLPPQTSFGFVTGCQMAHVTCLAAARHKLLADLGWDVERQGLQNAPRLRVLAGEQRHVTIDRALRLLGVGTDALETVSTDRMGRMKPDALGAALQTGDAPTIVCVQVGEVNTGAMDPVGDLIAVARPSGAWVHVDGAFGLWAAVSPQLRGMVRGVDGADSWATDCHKWLNVPYDSGLALCAHPDAHRGAMSTQAPYLVQAPTGGPRDAIDWNPEFSRRARGFAVWAALRSLGRAGVVDLVDRSCAHARLFAELLGADPSIDILNDVGLNQVLLRFRAADGDHDAHTAEVIDQVQREGVCWLSGTVWNGMTCMRISVCNWRTTVDDVERSVASILRAAAATG